MDLVRLISSFILFLIAARGEGQAGPGPIAGEGLFPLGEEKTPTSSFNPAFPAHNTGVHSSLRVHDRFLLPELALQEFRINSEFGKGNAFLTLSHYGNELFRQGCSLLGYALPIGEKSGIGIALGTSQLRIGEGHGSRTSWRARAGIRAGSGKHWKWELYFSDPHAAFHDPPRRDLLSPAINAGLGRKWKGGHVWTLHLRKELDEPPSYSSRSRFILHERLRFIAGFAGPPLAPLMGCGFSWKAFHFRLICGWSPQLGITPETKLFHHFNP